ncbi:filamentous hemagglutinin N-terminal domain-containing protein [Polynucleobacter sp. 86C-FISCH]|uniref:beta strand repeat-containing protein n=1 Tax=Polynucleobacter sp. 86C-FISCH TaxID=2689101 RepID=UPI001C0D7BA6|nr:YDG domain-containing protein [Polynucleobacter sp. 86C-FISCH]MBU3594824.1 filamentous hemagglutinin N-terminal domain-containing protein [Polynucleobacter sp. 86C-FISCH]
MSARTVAFIFSASAALFSQTIFAQAPAPVATQPAVNALPTGGKVVAGAATISQTQTATSATMNVNQTSQRAVVNWDSFNVGKNAQVNFNQPNQNAVILNRVTGGNASVINGAINANGQVVLVNPNGVAFGRGAQVDAASVVASTLDISNKEFMEGKSTFRGNGKGTIVNEGKITTNVEGGYIALLAPEVRNQGYLLAKKGGGTVAMAAGEQITLNFQNNYLISVKVDTGTYNALIENKRVVEVNGGLVVVAAGSAHQLMASVIKNTGRISASTAVNNGGVIELVANNVTQAGKVSANSQSAQGGQINIVGNDITIAQNSKTEATGATGGGQVNIGLASTQVTGGTQVNAQTPGAQTNAQAEATIKANAQAASSAKQMARTVTIEKDAVIDASATKAGNGGTIAIWSEIKTTVAGVLKSTGGALSGNGGFIETSSKGHVNLAPTVSVNTAANNKTGKSGTWLLDPIDLTIDSAAANVISAALSNNNVTIEVNANTTACPSLGGCTQNGSGSLTIASGADILKAGGNMTTLTLNSSGIFNLNANISGQNLSVIINSSIAYLNVGSSITASEVTVQAQTIYASGNIQTSPYSLANNSNSLGNAIKLLAQAIYVSGGLSLNANLPSNSVQIVTVGGVAKRPDELPSYLTAQNTNQSTNLNQVYSATAANDANAIQVLQANPASQSNVIYLTASNQLSINPTAQVLANGTTGGSIYAQAPVINTQAGSVVQANGNNGPGGVIAFSGDQITVAGNIAANGTTDGGSIALIANNGDLTMNSGTIQTNGSNGRGGSIGISANNHLAITSSAIEATGYTQGGKILIGNDAKNGTLPFALSATLDQYSSLNTAQLDSNQANQNGGFIETSGQTLSMMASINAGRGGMWLLDPTNVTISTTAGTSTGTDPLLFTNQTNVSATQIQDAINNGISVQIIADGAITQTANLSFSIASGSSASLTLDNSSGTAQAITLTGTTTNTGAGDLNLNYISNGQIKINGAINSTSTGKINVVAKTNYATNTLTTCTAGACASIYNGASGSITTKGGYVVMDATGGSVSGTTITIGSIQNGPIYLNAAINTTTAGTSASGSGGNFSLAASANLASGIGSFEPNVATLNIGGNATFSLKNYTNASYGFVVASYATTSPITAYGNIDITSIGVSTSNTGLIYLTSALTSTAGNITLTATSTNTSATLNPGVSGTATGTLTANAGAITVTSTSNASTAVSLIGAMSAKSIAITGTSTTAATIVSLGAMTIVAGGTDLSVTANNTAGGANTGITQTGAITVNSDGGNISFISNNIINQAGAITLAANTSGTASTVLYDTTAGAKTSTITAGALTVSSGSTSAVNYIVKTSGAGIDTGILNVPGSVLLDNSYGGTAGVGGTPTSGYITTANSATFAGASIGVLVNAAITAGTGITLKGASFTGWYSVTLQAAISTATGSIAISGSGVDYAVHTGSLGTILASAGAVTITGTSTTGQAVNLGALVTGNSITITGTGTAAATIMSLSALTINVGGSDLTVTANNTSGGGNTGITQTGAITANASGGNITFTSNHLINQTGAIALAANVSGNAATVTYDTTRGANTSTITGGNLTIGSGSTSAINYVQKSAGANLDPGVINVPGTITLDNTYGCTGTGCTPASGYIVASNITSGPSGVAGVTINGALTATGNIVVKGVSNGNYSIYGTAAVTSSAGSIAWTGIATNYGIYTGSLGTILASAGAVTITGTSTTGQAVNLGALVTGNSITITGTGTAAATIMSLSALTINVGGSDLTVTANNTSGGGNTGITQTGAITANASGGNITFTSNHLINQTGAIALAANVSGNAATVTYDTTTGTKASSITSGTITIGSSSTSDINFMMTSLGSAINPGAIGTSSARLPGTVTLDNTYGGATPTSGYITTSNNSTLATSSVGATINNAIYSTKLISVKGISYASHGIGYSAAINASGGGVELTGTTYNSYGVYTASSLVTGNFITINARASVAATYVAYLGPMTINSGSTGGDITITSTGTTAGSDAGITQIGAISAVNGSDISFIANNIIDQRGAISMAANTNAVSTITYDTTGGNRLSNITTGVVTTTAGSTYAINYLVKSAGSAINANDISVPGYINIDNTYGSASGAKLSGYLTGANIATSNTTASIGVLVGGVLTAGGSLTIKGVTASSWGIQNSSSTLTAGSGDLTLVGIGAHGMYQLGSLIAPAGSISVSAYALSSTWAYYAQVGSQKNYIASGNIDLVAYSTSYSSGLNIQNILMRTTTGDITLSARGGLTGNGSSHPAIHLVGDVISAGGDFIIQGATNTGGIATASPSAAAMNTMGDTGVHITSSASLAYGGTTYTGYKAAGDIVLTASTSGSYGFYVAAPIESTAGSVTLTGTSTAAYGIYTTSTGTITGVTGVALYGRGTSGNIYTAALVRNTGSTGGIIINATGNANIGAVTNSGADGIRITGGNGVAAGTTTGGTIIALGTVTNTGGVVALSMAAPRTANSYDVEGAVGITSSNASTSNVRYSVQGGTFTTPTTYTSGNYIDYRSGTTSYTITVSLGANYSAAYGTAYTDSSALTWLRSNATVTLSATPFGVSTAGIKDGLVWNSTIGSAGINANAVQAGTTIVSANISAGTGQAVTLSGTSRTYTITAKALTITNLASTSSYDASTTYASLVNTAGYSVSGLVTSIGGVAVTDSVASVTQTIKSGSVVGSGSVVSGVAQNGSFNTVPSSAVGVGLSNYTITYVGVVSTVNKATLTIAAANDTKVYGNTSTTAGITYSAGAASASSGVGYSITSGSLFGSDTLTGVTLTSTGGAATTAVGTGISIVPSAASGSGIGNYTITYANGAMAVTQRPLTITASTQNTNYGTSYALGTSSFTSSGLVNSDAVSSVTLKYSGATTVAGTTNAGTYTSGIIASAASGTGLSNYSISYVAGNLVVATKALTITASAQNSTYGSAYALGTSAFTTSGLVNSDSVTSAILLYSGNATVSPTVNAATYSAGIIPSAASGVGLSNYAISYVAGNLVVGKATLTLTPNAVSTIYNDTTLNNSTYSQLTSNYTSSGYKNTDVAANVPVTLSGSMAFNGSATTVVKNAATYALTVGTLAGTTSNGNYQIAFANPSSNAYVINPATVSVSASKDYDGSRSFAANQVTVLTGIGTQTLTLSGSANADSANVASVSSLSTAGLSLGNGSGGGLAGNYVLPTSTSSVVIRPLTVSASIAGSPSKQYDTNTSATLVSGNFSLAGFITGEGATVTQTVGVYNSANASTNTAYSPASTVTASLIPSHFTADTGTVLSNYVLPTGATGAGVITAAPLTVSANSYAGFAGQAPASFDGTVSGAKGADAITVNVTQSSTATNGVYTLTPAAVMSASIVGNYGTPTVVTGTYTEALPYQLVVTAANSTNTYGSISGTSTANTPVNLMAQYCTVSSGSCAGNIITLSLTAPSATVSQITTSSVTTPTWVATDSALNTYSLKATSDTTLGFSAGNYLNVGNYIFTPTGQANATISGSTLPVIYIPGTATVSPLNVTAANNSTPTKVYDATVALTNGISLTPSNKLAGDVLSLSGAGVYSNKNVGTTNYTITSVSLSGADAANYRYTAGNIAGTNGSITPAPITISGLSAANKTYDAGFTAVISGTASAVGALGGDVVGVTGNATTGTFTSANAGSGIVVTPVLSGLSLSDTNYEINGVTTPLTANISAAPVTATINRPYDGTTSVANANIAITGVSGQTLTLATGTATLTNPNVGSAGLSSLNGATLADGTGLATNYTLTNPTGIVNITPASISVTSSNAAKVYDATTAVTSATTVPVATLSAGTLYTNTATGDVDALSGGSFEYLTSGVGNGNKSVSVNSVGVLNGSSNAAANYSITYVDNTTSTITPAPITISGLTASNKQYDTGLVAVVSGTATANGTLGADSVAVLGSATVGSFASANVGTGIAVTPVLSGLSLSNANYQITGVSSALSANITAAPVTISGITAANKTYDTGTAATISGSPIADGVLGADVVTVAGSVTAGSFASANVGTGIVVTPTISGLSLSNANYQITGLTNSITANITAAPVTVTADNQSTIYGTPLSLGTASFTVTGLLGSDAISGVTLTQQGNTTVPGTQNAGTYSGAVNGILPSAASGTNLSNYQITYTPGTLAIARKAINLVADNASMTYADTSLPTLSYQTVSGLVNGDQMSGVLATTATPWTTAGSASNIGSYYITQGTVTAGSNYDITYTRASLTVNPANLYVTAENQTTTYGSLLVLPQSGSAAYSVAGLRNDDSVSSATVLYNGNQTIPATTNAGLYAASISISDVNGIRLGNYNVGYTSGDLTVAKALLTVTAVDSAKFVGTSDPSGFSGVMYSGFKNADSDTSGALGSAVVSVSRNNSSSNNAGVYGDVLVPNVSTSLQNYNVGYVNGKFTIVGANELLVQVGSNTTAYGTPASYSAGAMTVSYCTDCAIGVSSPNIISIIGADITASGSAVTVVTGNTTGSFTVSPVNPTMNAAGTQIGVGSYGLRATSTDISTSPPGGTPNFNAIYVVGGLNVTPLQLTYADLGISGLSQVYNGTVNMTNLGITATSGILPGDAVSVLASGTFASKNVGINIPYTVAIGLTGQDASNYQINNSTPLAGTNGVITQLNSVTYTGPTTGGSWSNPANWTTTDTIGANRVQTGAIPDLSNVANVILPTGYSVIYDDSVQGPVTSAVANSGNLNFNLSSANVIPMAISGAGSVTISNAGAITLTGNSSFTGGTNIGAGTSLIAGSNNALGSGLVNSSGTAASPANFSTTSGITMPALSIVGGTTAILSDISTAGAQSYSGNLIIGTSGTGTTTFQSANSNILIDATINGAVNKAESLVINAGTGIVTLGDSTGNAARLNNFTITGSRINILADILTAVTQTYNGAVYIGDASYLGRTPSVGFLYTDNYRGYFQYVAGSGVRSSTISYLDSNPIYVRTMISEDPSITYNGTVNDTVANTHTLLVAAIAPTAIPYSSGYAVVNSGATISFNAPVGSSAPLYSLNAQTVVNNSQVGAANSYIGTVNLIDSVATYSDQTYRANLMNAQSSAAPATVTFSVWDPAANVSFNLPEQSVANSGCSSNCGQINLQNPGSLDSLVINGSSNFALDANLTGVNNWGNQFTSANALGYLAPTTTPPAPTPTITAAEPAPALNTPLVLASYIPREGVAAGALREVIDFHADQVQYAANSRSFGGVSVSTPEDTEVISSKSGKSKGKSLDEASTTNICTVDQSGNTKCEED